MDPLGPGGESHTPMTNDATAHHVNVLEAEYIFEEFSEALARRSETPVDVDADVDVKSSTRSSTRPGTIDVEKGAFEDSEERFDLREYLQSSNDANQAAGIKHKHVGVTWENLQVEVPGGGDYKVDRIVSSSELTVDSTSLDLHRNVRGYVIILQKSSRLNCILGAILSFLLLPLTFVWDIISHFLPASLKRERLMPILHA